MYENVGGKLKTLAKVICGIGIVCSILYGIVLIAGGAGGSMVFSGILTIILGSLGSWIGSWTMYAIGETAERTEQILAQLSMGNRGATDIGARTSSPLSNAAASYEQERKRKEWTCACGATNSSSAAYCWRCRRSRSESDTANVANIKLCPHCGAKNSPGNTTCFACNKPF